MHMVFTLKRGKQKQRLDFLSIHNAILHCALHCAICILLKSELLNHEENSICKKIEIGINSSDNFGGGANEDTIIEINILLQYAMG